MASLLNLHRWIPQRDVRKLIYRLFDRNDRIIIMYAHTGRGPVGYLLERLLIHSATSGCLERVLWAVRIRKTSGLHVNYADIGNSAAKHGHLNILQWVHSVRGGDIIETVCTTAAHYGHLDIVKWAFSVGFGYVDFRGCLRSRYTHVVEWIEEFVYLRRINSQC